MGRPLRVIQNIYPYHLTCRTNNRTFRFNQRQVTRIFFQALKETHEKYSFLIHHVVLMSDHYHIIATTTEENLHRAMQYLNSRIAVRYNKMVGRSGHLWGGRYGSCIIDTDEYYMACVRYIYRNPKRAGMVDDLEEFSYSSFQFWAFGNKLDVLLVDDHLAMRWGKGKRRSREFFKILVLDEGFGFTDDNVKKGLRRMFFGSADFKQQMYDTYCCPAS
ncbi:MAG: transposase [bacterium]|nr:transposase [bacterium]MDT8367291.1 transposase [bacterium]